jgi:protein-S-isoprenylcysteine O-methyltransferase Ste14
VESKIIIVITAGILAFALDSLFDWVSVRGVAKVKPVIALIFWGLHGFAFFVALWQVEKFEFPTALSILGWIALPIFVYLLVYSLILELPMRETYSVAGVSGRLVKTGTYALTRHPGAIWYVLGMISLLLASRSVVLLALVPVWSILEILHVIVQDRLVFVKMFPEYSQYQRETPMLIPTRRSLAACIKTFKIRPDLMLKMQI